MSPCHNGENGALTIAGAVELSFRQSNEEREVCKRGFGGEQHDDVSVGRFREE